MLLEITKFLVDSMVEVWNFLMDAGTVGYLILLLPILKRLSSIMKKFT